MDLSRASDKGLREICQQHSERLGEIYREIRRRAIEEEQKEQLSLVEREETPTK